jgi:hypothetical protein
MPRFYRIFLLIGFSLALLFRWQLAYPGQPVPVIGARFGELNAPSSRVGRTRLDLVSAENPLGLDTTDPAAKDDIWTQNQLNLPAGRPVIVHLSSKDVIHSFGLPQMRVKQDAIPDTEQRLWFTPTRTGEWEIAKKNGGVPGAGTPPMEDRLRRCGAVADVAVDYFFVPFVASGLADATCFGAAFAAARVTLSAILWPLSSL